MSIASIKTYHDQIDGLLDTASMQHDDAQLATLGAVVQERRGNWKAVADRSVQDTAVQIVNVLAQADATLEPNQVKELEKHVAKRLPGAARTTSSAWIEVSRAVPQTVVFTDEPLPVETLMSRQGVTARPGPVSIVPENVTDDELDAFVRAVEHL